MALLALTTEDASPCDMCTALAQLPGCRDFPNKDAWMKYSIRAMAGYREGMTGQSCFMFDMAQTWQAVERAFKQSSTPEHVHLAEKVLQKVFATLERPNKKNNDKNTSSADLKLAALGRAIACLMSEAMREVSDFAVDELATESLKLSQVFDERLKETQHDHHQPVRMKDLLPRAELVLTNFAQSKEFKAEEHEKVVAALAQLELNRMWTRGIKQAQQPHQASASASAAAAASSSAASVVDVGYVEADQHQGDLPVALVIGAVQSR